MTKINEEINISGSAEELLRLMKLAGADDAKAVDAGDISSHTHAEPETGGCGSSPEMDMGDYIRMVSTEEIEESLEDYFHEMEGVSVRHMKVTTE